MTNQDSILKSRDFIKKETLPTKVRLAKAVVFPVVMYGYEIGPYKRLSTEELILLNCDLKKTLESPLDCKELKPINPKGNQP